MKLQKRAREEAKFTGVASSGFCLSRPSAFRLVRFRGGESHI